jgi:hypothetical protein
MYKKRLPLVEEAFLYDCLISNQDFETNWD